MRNTTFTVIFNTEKLNALAFHVEKKSADLQSELNKTIQKLYEKYVPQAAREYTDDRVNRDAIGRECPCHPPKPAPRPAAEAAVQEEAE